LSVGFFAKLLSLPADPAEQDSQQKTEFERFQLEQEQIDALQEAKLWQKLDLAEKDDLFTAGLLHDIGKVSMQMCLEDSLELIMAVIESEVQEAQGQSKLWANSVIDIERLLMKDLDHQVIGGRIAEKWEVDDSLQAVVTRLHDIQEHSPDIVKVVAFANMAANCLFPYPATETQHPFPQLFARIDAAVKKSSKSGPAAVEEAINEEIFEDLVDVLNRLKIPSFLWELVDFRTFFKLTHILSPKIKAATIGFLQQTGG
jgi:HD-like signal output (HDOD) protein